MKAVSLPITNKLDETIIELLEGGLDKGLFEAILLPKRVPSGDSFAYLLIKDKSVLEGASIVPAVMPVQGAKALSNLTRYGSLNRRILAVMRPCEIRAAVELCKLEQVDLSNVSFLSFDCPGAMPLADYVEDPTKCDELFDDAIAKHETEHMRPACQMCREPSVTSADIHIGQFGADGGNVLLIANTDWGAELLDSLGVQSEGSLESWTQEVEKVKADRKGRRDSVHNDLNADLSKPAGLLDLFANCINCHNCMRVCPLCYCRQCYFDSEALQMSPENFLARAEKNGSLRLPADTTFFHLGRMSHMITSCVSCGQCEDACPMDIKVGQVFGLVADRTQKVFEYVAGMNIDEPLPCTSYEEEELQDFEKPYTQVYEEGVLSDVQSAESR